MKLLSTLFLVLLFLQSHSQECTTASMYKTSSMSERLDSVEMEIPLYFRISADSIVASPIENDQTRWMALKIISKQCFKNEKMFVDKIIYKTVATSRSGMINPVVTIHLADSLRKYIEIFYQKIKPKFFPIEEVFETAAQINEFCIPKAYPADQKLPFVIKDLPFELQVTRLNMDCSLLLTVKKGHEREREKMLTGVYDFIENFNQASMKKDREEGVVHNVNGKIQGTNIVAFQIDLGSVGFGFFEKLLKFLARLEGIQKVTIA